MERVDCVVIGAGVVGLSIARSLAIAGREVMVLEAESAIGSQTSARNSEVIHAGISYAAGSLKGRLCAQGKELLYAYCNERGIGHRRVGKLIVAAQESEKEDLAKYLVWAAGNGVTDLRPVSAAEARELEPEVSCVSALLSPSTGIIDSHALMLSYLGDAQYNGAVLALQSKVVSGAATHDGIVLNVGGAEEMTILCKTVINAAGLYAQELASNIEGLSPEFVPPAFYAIGHYFTMSGKSPFNRLVYPVGRDGALRAHVTIDLGGQCKFGPDFQWIDKIDYSFDQTRAPRFYEAVRRYYPNLKDGALQPGYTGIRPRLGGPGQSLHNNATDFLIMDESQHGVPGLINLFGIESPGLTSSLALGAYVSQLCASENQ
jgi:L-2-hydroxyglutarate oxidase LhgO